MIPINMLFKIEQGQPSPAPFEDLGKRAKRALGLAGLTFVTKNCKTARVISTHILVKYLTNYSFSGELRANHPYCIPDGSNVTFTLLVEHNHEDYKGRKLHSMEGKPLLGFFDCETEDTANDKLSLQIPQTENMSEEATKSIAEGRLWPTPSQREAQLSKKKLDLYDQLFEQIKPLSARFVLSASELTFKTLIDLGIIEVSTDKDLSRYKRAGMRFPTYSFIAHLKVGWNINDSKHLDSLNFYKSTSKITGSIIFACRNEPIIPYGHLEVEEKS